MKHSTGTPTKAEKARMDKMKELGACVACYQTGLPHKQYIEIHHLLSGNKRRGHMFTVSLCAWHHRGVTDGVTSKVMETMFGPSLAKGSKPFHFWFGTDEELLQAQNRLLSHGD